jgi:eukaryotic-like serine/threonine-protein kinase
MTTFPAAGDYYKAVQAPARAFTVPKLQAAEFVWDALGPSLARGSSAVVFQAAVEGQPQALRCYIRNDASSRDRYGALGAYLARHDLSPVVSGTTWLDSAIRVKGATWPVLQMEWIDGRTLNEYVDFLVAGSNTVALATLAVRWREMVALLQDSDFAHGDLQHGNVMVDQEGQLRLVDFDGVWIPQLAGQAPPTEYGHPNYQHPGRHDWGRWLDTFSALVVYLSLVALSKDPSLWLALYNSKNLLFAKADFFPPFETEAWKQLAALHDPQVDELTRRLQECCAVGWVSDRSLEQTLAQPAAPAPASSPIPAELRWWEKKSAAPGGFAPAAPGDAAAPSGSPPTVIISAAVSAAASLPTPPPLSAPLGLAGTGPLPQLRPTMAPAGATWWTGPGSGSTPPPAWPGPAGPVPPRPGLPAPAPAPPGPVVKRQQAQTVGGLSLGLGLVLLIVGAASHVGVLVIIGLLAAAWGVWRLVTLTGTNTKPPGRT